MTAAPRHRVLTVGRGRQADVRLDHPTVSSQHLELVLGSGGEIHAADRSSRNGTRIGADGGWRPLRAESVSPADRLRLGSFEITVEDLVRRAPREQANHGGPAGSAGSGERPSVRDPDLPSGRVRRNPETGEVIRA